MGDKLTNIVQIYMTLPIQAGFILANTLKRFANAKLGKQLHKCISGNLARQKLQPKNSATIEVPFKVILLE